MKLRKGMIVNYHPTPTECGKMREHRSTCNISEELPAVVVAVWGEEMVNLKVLLDGVGDQWATSVHKGDGVGEWDFYPEDEIADEAEFRGDDFKAAVTLEQMATKSDLLELEKPDLSGVSETANISEQPKEESEEAAQDNQLKEIIVEEQPKLAAAAPIKPTKGGKKV